MSDNEILIGSRAISKRHPPFVIAELSANHKGSLSRAKETMLAAVKAGVDAVKIQTYTPDTMTIQSNKPDFRIDEGLWQGRSLYELYEEAHTPFEWHQELFSYASKIGLTLFSSPFDETAVDLLDFLDTPAYKVASFEIVDLALIKYIARKRKPLFISTGMASLDEISNAIDAARCVGNEHIVLFHCISSYPTPISEANLNMIRILETEFDLQVGFSDHTIGNLACILATSLGATAIEKHFTLQRSDGGVDGSFSIEPHEMRSLVDETKKVFSALGPNEFERSPFEKQNTLFRRSLYFVNDVEEGDLLTEKNVKRIRPGFGLDAKFYEAIIGSKCLKAAKRGDRVTFNHVEIRSN